MNIMNPLSKKNRWAYYNRKQSGCGTPTGEKAAGKK